MSVKEGDRVRNDEGQEGIVTRAAGEQVWVEVDGQVLLGMIDEWGAVAGAAPQTTAGAQEEPVDLTDSFMYV